MENLFINKLLILSSILFIIILTIPFASAENLVISEISAQNFTGLPNKDFEGTFKITNNISQSLNVNIDYSGLSGLDIEFSEDDLDLNPGESATIDFDITSEPGDKGVFTGSFIARDNKGNQTSFNVMVNLTFSNTSMLKIESVLFDGDSLEAGKNVSGLKAGQLVDLEFVLENLFNEDDDPSIENFEFDVRIEDIADDDTQDLDIVIKDADQSIEPDKSLRFYSEDFRIPYDISSKKSYNLIIEVDADDDENQDYHVEFEAFVIPEKEDEDIGFADVKSPSSVKCGDAFDVEVELANTGIKDVEDGSFIAEIKELKLLSSGKTFDEIENNETVSDKVSLKIPSDANAKTYSLYLTTFFKGKEKQSESHEIVVSCEAPAQNQTSQNNTNQQTQQQNQSIDTQQNTNQNKSAQTNVTQQDNDRVDSIDIERGNKGATIWVLSGMILLIIILVVLLVIMYKKK